ncbi:MAG TPA: TonB-dependent receptor [Thermoanaerobaculia bacterium]|nr:TonB-dependent receptor [Thermoanaerobaculia bacterium]
MKRFPVATVALALLCLPAMADSPETGIIEGVVRDAAGNPLPAVVVSLAGPRGEQSVVTDGVGFYRFSLLVPGDYRVRAEMDGFQPASANVSATAGGRATADLSLRLGTSEEITVTSEAPMVDKFNVTAGATVTAEVGEQTAGTTRTYYGLINALPGVASDSQNDDIQQTRPSVNGTHFADQQVFVDGVDTTFAKFGGSRVFLPTTAVSEVSMEGGGSSAEYGRTIGSSTNVIVKSGTNRFHVDTLVQHQKVKWGGDYKDQSALLVRQDFPRPANFFERTPVEEDGDSTGFEASLGGPIKRDRAWFFLGWSDFDDNYIEKTLGNDFVDTSLETEARIAKLNLQPATSHQLSASLLDTPAQRVYFNPETFDYWVPTPHVNDSSLVSGNWNWSISNSLFLETKLASQTSTENKELACFSSDIDVCLAQKQQDRGGPDVFRAAEGDGPLRFPGDPTLGRHLPGNNYDVYFDGNNDGSWHNGWLLSDGFGDNEFPRDQANASLTQFIGNNHEVKYGIDFQNTEWSGEQSRTAVHTGWNFDSRNRFGYAGAGDFGFTNPAFANGFDATLFGENTCGFIRSTAAFWPFLGAFVPGGIATLGRGRYCAFVDYNADFLLADAGTGDAETENYAAYVRDRFTIGDHWTFNLGVRYDTQTAFNDTRRKVIDASYFDPRVSVTYDIKGDGRLLFSLNAGTYHAMLNQAWVAGSGFGGSLQDNWNGYEGARQLLFCDQFDAQFWFIFEPFVPQLAACAQGVGMYYNLAEIRPGRYWELVDQGIFDSNIDPYHKEEIILGFEWQMSQNWALDVKYIDWQLEDMIGQTTQQDHTGKQFFLTANYSDYPDILRKIEQARIDSGTPCPLSVVTGQPTGRGCTEPNGTYRPLMTEDILSQWGDGFNEYRALQVQINRRFANGWALYNNISWSETDTTGAGAWWNNTNASYGEELHTVLTQGNIADCQSNQAVRTVPVDCQEAWGQFVGTPASLINRAGPNNVTDRPIIFNSFGYKTWRIANQDVTLGGHFSFQSGLPWARSEGVSTFSLDGNTAANGGVTIPIDEDGARGWRNEDEYTLNLSGAWGFPLGGNVRGEFRTEVVNVTNEQRQRLTTSRGEARAIRRDFQRPRQVRASFRVRF